jgi:hypothetical protein
MTLVSLAAEEKRFDLKQAKFYLQRKLAWAFTWIFLLINTIVITAIIILGLAEWNALAEGREIERLITSELIMTLLGATTVQLGTIMLTMAKHLFPPGVSEE